MRIVKLFLVLVVIVGTILFLTRNRVVKMVVSRGVETVTGLKSDMKKIDVGIAKTLIDIQGLELLNPPGFPDKVMANLPEVYVDYDLGAFFKGKVHLEEVRLHLKEFTVIKNEKGRLNIDTFKRDRIKKERKWVRPEKKEEETSRIQIDVLELRVDKVIYKDYSGGKPVSIREFDVDIEERYGNITDPYAFGRLIVTRSLIKTAISKLVDLDLEDIEIKITDTIVKYTGKVIKTTEATREVSKDVAETAREMTEAAKEKAEEAVDALRRILPLRE